MVLLCPERRSFNRIVNGEKGFCEERSDEAISQKQPECQIYGLS
jgi:hypothetical protein